MYSGDNIEAIPTPTPQTMRYRMNGVSAAGPMLPMGPKPNSGYAEPGRQEEQGTRDHHAALAADGIGNPAGHQGADDAAE